MSERLLGYRIFADDFDAGMGDALDEGEHAVCPIGSRRLASHCRHPGESVAVRALLQAVIPA
jgi:hypothetical protein